MGFTDWEQKDLTVAAGANPELEIRLVLGARAEQMSVVAAQGTTVTPDPSQNADALVLTATDLDALADDPADLATDLQVLAGPTAGPNGAQIFIDGFTGGRLPPKQSIREVRINQNPFAAQYERPGQGRVEIFTKAGADQLRGSVLFQFGDDIFNSRNPFVSVRPPYQRRQWKGELGGPLNKKTSYYLTFERRDLDENAVVNALVLDSSFGIVPLRQGIVTPMTDIESSAKIDRQLSKNHSMSARYQYARDTASTMGIGGFTLASRAYDQGVTSHTFQVVETAVLNAQTVNELRFRYLRQNSSQMDSTSGAAIVVPDAFSGGGAAIGNSFDRQNRFELQNWTSRVQGKHLVQWGGLLRAIELNSQAQQNYAGTFLFTSLDSYRTTLTGLRDGLTAAQIRALGGGASQFTLTAGKPLASVNQLDFGLYLQDDWKVRPNLVLSGGLRYEGQTNAKLGRNFAPRAGIAWSPGKKHGVIRGGFGIFYTRLSEGLTLNALRQNGVQQQLYLIQNPDFYPRVPSADSLAGGMQAQAIRMADANWQAPQMIQASVAYERQVSKQLTITTSFLRSMGVHQLRSRNINAPAANAIYLYESSGVFRQNQWITTVAARVNKKVSFNGSYAYGRAGSNTDGVGTFPANQYDLSTEYGRAAFDIRHRVSLTGSIVAPWGIRFSPLISTESGRPYNITTGTDLNGDSLYTDRPSFAPDGSLNPRPRAGETIIPRNYGVGPAQFLSNLRASKTFQFDSLQLTFSANARNVLNHQNLAPQSGNMSSLFFGQSTALASGSSASANRKIDFQMRLNF